MKRGICIALSAFLLAAPVQAKAQERISGYEIKETPHTFTVKAGADGLAKDGEVLALPEGAAIYPKDGAMMLPAEPFLKALMDDISLRWATSEEGILYASYGQGTITFDAKKKQVLMDGNTSINAGGMELRGNQLFLPVREWEKILPEFYCKVKGISWDAKTQTAKIEISVEELEIKGELPTPAGEGVMPEYILQPTGKYERIKNFGDGYFSTISVVPEHKQFILNNTGKVIQSYKQGFEIQYAGEGFFQIAELGSRRDGGYIADKNGKKIFATSYDDEIWFSEGLSRTQTRAGTGVLNTKGELVIPAKYSFVRNFSEGLASVGILAKSESKAFYKWGFIDREGRLVIDTQYDYTGSFHEGLARVKRDGGKYGYIDKAGREVILPQYDWAGNFCNGKALVLEGKGTENGKLWAVDRTGKKLKLVAEIPTVDEAWDIPGIALTENVAMFRGKPKYFTTYYNADGELTYAESIWVQNASEGLMVVQDEKTEKWGYVDKDWHWVIAPIFDDVESFRDGYAVVQLKTEQGDTEKGIIKKP